MRSKHRVKQRKSYNRVYEMSLTQHVRSKAIYHEHYRSGIIENGLIYFYIDM